MSGPCGRSHGPTANAIRYDGNASVRSNVTFFQPPGSCSVLVSALLATATSPSGTISVMSHGCLKLGSSKPGNVLRAPSASICVTT